MPPLIFVLAVTVTVTGAVAAALPEQRVCLQAEQLLRREPKALAQAQQVLHDAKESCRAFHDESTCEADFESCLGFLQILSAELDRDADTDSLLCNALPHLKRVYFEYGRTEAGAVNLALAYQRLQDYTTAAEVLSDFAYSTGSRSSQFLVKAGDSYREAGDSYSIRKAARMYREASRLSPLDETPQRRLLEVQQTKPGSLRKQSDSYRMRSLFLVARDGYENVIRQLVSTHQGKGVEADAALIGWVETIAAIGNASEHDLERLPSPESWKSRGLEELKVLLEDPVSGVTRLNWWTRGEVWTLSGVQVIHRLARIAAASLLLDLSRRYLSEGRYLDAETILQRGFELAEFWRGLTDPSAFTRIDLARELGYFYLTHRQAVDPTGEKFENLIEELEGELIDVDSGELGLRLNEEYCETLGRLQVAAARMSKPASRTELAEGLKYLDRAIEIEQELWKSHPSSALPQPDIEELTAEIHLTDPEMHEKARDLYIAAARGYLDLDVLKGAEVSLDLAEKLPESEESRRSIMDLRKLLYLRRNPDRGLAALSEFDQRSHEPSQAGFLDRQRFKVLVDSGLSATDRGEQDEALRSHIKALRVFGRLSVLPSNEDVGRFLSALNTILEAKPVISLGTSTDFQRPILKAPYLLKEFALPSSSGRPGARLRVGIDVFLAAELRWFLLEEELYVPPELTFSLVDQRLFLFSGEDVPIDVVQALTAKIEEKKISFELLEEGNRRSVRELKGPRIRRGAGLRTRTSVASFPPSQPRLCRDLARLNQD